MSSKGWIGVDLDGTLAEYYEWKGPDQIGPPVPEMLQRVKDWLAKGFDVRIFTARVYAGDSIERRLEAQKARKAIWDWCVEHLGIALPITCEKDFGMIELWDDRCVQVEQNTGRPVGRSTRGLS